MKIDSGFKSLNYAICVMCILEGDEQAKEQLRPHLPRSDVAWARSLRLLSPVPEIFVKNWLRNLTEPDKQLDIYRLDRGFKRKKTLEVFGYSSPEFCIFHDIGGHPGRLLELLNLSLWTFSSLKPSCRYS